LQVTAVMPLGPPARFRLRGEDYRITRTWGPERIETSWWRGHMVRRDYYRVETRDGQWFWLYRRLQDGKWFLHGRFA
jgi:protein ImuB